MIARRAPNHLQLERARPAERRALQQRQARRRRGRGCVREGARGGGGAADAGGEVEAV